TYVLPNNKIIRYEFVKYNQKLTNISNNVKTYLLKLIDESIKKIIKEIPIKGKQLTFTNRINEKLNVAKLPQKVRNDLMLQLLNLISSERGESFNDWIKIGLCLSNSDNDVSLWDHYSKRSMCYDCHSNQKYYDNIFNVNRIKHNSSVT